MAVAVASAAACRMAKACVLLDLVYACAYGVAGEYWNSVTYETHAGRVVGGCCARTAEAEVEESGNENEKGKKEECWCAISPQTTTPTVRPAAAGVIGVIGKPKKSTSENVHVGSRSNWRLGGARVEVGAGVCQ
jgi:hypothetical protein